MQPKAWHNLAPEGVNGMLNGPSTIDMIAHYYCFE